MELIVTTTEQLEKIIQEIISRAVNFQQAPPEIPDKTDLGGACEFLNQLGYKVPKSTIYKLSHNDDIPCMRIGRRLLFSRKELQSWFEKRLKSKPRYNASVELAKSAQRKFKKG